MAQSIVDNELLSAVKVWLEPLPDKSLPALDIQNALFDILIKVRRSLRTSPKLLSSDSPLLFSSSFFCPCACFAR